LVKFLAILFFSSTAFAEIKFFCQCDKTSIYFGEKANCNFVLTSNEDRILDVEVVKFAEFRGYWTQNLSLRQGPLPMGFTPTPIGGYEIAPMLNFKSPEIIPMKISIARFGQGEPIYLESEPPQLKLLPLPPIKKDLAEKFHGGVGEFFVSASAGSGAFNTDEPITLYYYLQGSGNFSEFAPFKLPSIPNVEILSEKSFSTGENSRSYEFSLKANEATDFSIPSFAWVYFNPRKKTYETLTFPEIKMQYQKIQAPPPEPIEEKMVLEEEPDFFVPWWKSIGFYLMNILFGLTTLGVLIARGFRRWKNRAPSPEKLRTILKTLKDSDPEKTLACLNQLSMTPKTSVADQAHRTLKLLHTVRYSPSPSVPLLKDAATELQKLIHLLES